MTKGELKIQLELFRQKSEAIRRATLDTMFDETEEQRQLRVASLLQPHKYADFFDYYFGRNTPEPLADSECAWFHRDSYTELFNNPYIMQFRLWFRGAAKSIHSNVGNALALKQNNQMRFMLVVGVNQDRANLLLSDIQAHLQYNQRIINDYGQQAVYGSWKDGQFQTADGTMFMALGIDQPFRGLRTGANRIDYAVLDDVEDRKVAKNDRIVHERTEKVLSDLLPAFGKHRQRVVVSNNFIENKGVVGTLIEKKKNSIYSKVMRVDLVDSSGAPEWSERYSHTDILRIQADNDFFTYSREYMNTPVEEGRLFKDTDLIFTEPLPLHKYSGIIGFWDLSYKDLGDFKALTIVGIVPPTIVGQGLFHVLHIYCRQNSLAAAIEHHFVKVSELMQQGVSPIFYFDATAAQEEVFLPPFYDYAKKVRQYNVPLPAHSNTDKYLRIEATLTAAFYNRAIRFSNELKGTADYEEAKLQLLAFERGSKAHDDFPDSLEAAVRIAQTYTPVTDLNTSVVKHTRTKGF